MLATKSQAQSGLVARLSDARNRTDELFNLVRPEALYDRPIAERHRIVFYIGHLEAFDWNLLRERILKAQSFNPELDHLFAFGIDPVDGGLPTDQPPDWPAISKVREYVQGVRDELDERLDTLLNADVGSGAGDSTSQLLNVAIEHRLMHAETLAYMLHQLPFDRKRSADVHLRASAVATPLRDPRDSKALIEIPAGPITLGLPHNSEQFGWDNEFEAQTLTVPPFSIDRHKVTNGEYLEFLTAGGYQNPSLWREEDWKWRDTAGITHPAFWTRKNSAWHWRGMFQEIPLPLDWPVYVSHAEASAYARWAGKSLPSEAQWQRAAYGTPDGRERHFPWGDEEPTSSFGNFDFANWDPTPVASHPAGASAFGVEDMLGNGWEWTSTPFQPLPGFVPFSFYPGYSANFFDGKHFVIKGGSPRTAACMLRPSFRNWFQPHYQYVYSAFRCVQNH